MVETPTTVFECFDIQTGQVYWDISQGGTTQWPTFIEYANSTTSAAISGGAITATLDYLAAGTVNTTSGAQLTPGRLVKYNPTTGAVSSNTTLDNPLSYSNLAFTHYSNGYCLSVQNLGSNVPVAQRYRLLNWTIAGTGTFASRIASNTSYALSAVPSCIDWNTLLAANTYSNTAGSGIMNSVNVTGYDLMTGNTLWTHLLTTTQCSAVHAVLQITAKSLLTYK